MNGVRLFGIALTAVACAAARGDVLPLDMFLGQVRQADPGYRSLVQASFGARTVSEKASLIFKPQFFSQLQYLDDTRSNPIPAIQGTSQIKRSASFGFRTQTAYGLGVQLSYDFASTSLINTDPTYVTSPTVTNGNVVPLFNFSLWQNFLGRADRANQRLMEAQDLATAYGKGYQAKAALTEAEGRYWKLAVTREVRKIEEESVSRARAILELNTRKQKQHLLDASDLLVSQSAVKGKELELRAVIDEERSAARSLNSARGIDSDDVPEQLVFPDADRLRLMELPKRIGHRGDVVAQEQATIAQDAGSEMAREKLLPDLSLYGSIYAWGLNFSFPLDVGTTSSVRRGYSEQAVSADSALQRKYIDEETEWRDLSLKFKEAKERFEIALELERIQRAKYEDIRKRKARGLTIEYQVFEYDLDYLNASLARVQIQGTILGLFAQGKLFSGGGQ